jgi:aryl-alcohol dehydrogenase-like predicted oxidoreductase
MAILQARYNLLDGRAPSGVLLPAVEHKAIKLITHPALNDFALRRLRRSDLCSRYEAAHPRHRVEWFPCHNLHSNQISQCDDERGQCLTSMIILPNIHVSADLP